jgi:hypothetical protein
LEAGGYASVRVTSFSWLQTRETRQSKETARQTDRQIEQTDNSRRSAVNGWRLCFSRRWLVFDQTHKTTTETGWQAMN